MSKKVDICDVCDERYPEYHFRYKAKRYWWYPFVGSHTETYDVCDKCWDKLKKMVRRSNQ